MHQNWRKYMKFQMNTQKLVNPMPLKFSPGKTARVYVGGGRSTERAEHQ
jgi:hypothetical protein